MENRSVLARAERIFEESLGDLRDVVGRLLSEFEVVLNGQDPGEIERARLEFVKELDRVEGRWT